ncbi:MAG: endonuclease III [Candidatus Pacebacteria bacterium]|nr:endonuclease III [Candidatus Paceibacterota bacterium]
MTPYKKKIRKERMQKMLKVFRKKFPDPISDLKYTTDFEFLVAVILSAQCTDARVNIVTRKLFKKYPKIKDYAKAKQSEMEKDVYSTGFYRNKAKNVIAAAKMVLNEFNGELPKNLKDLELIPGAGHKTACVVLSNLYGIHEGIAIDTHAIRIARKFDLCDAPYTPVSIERDLMEIVPQSEWGNMNHYLVLYGRYNAPAHAKEVHDELTAIYPKASYKLPPLPKKVSDRK